MYECDKYGAFFFLWRKNTQTLQIKNSIFTMCCQKGKVRLPEHKKPPQVLEQLLFGSG